MYACLVLPFPPTTNNLFDGNGRRRYVSEGYKAWRNEADRALFKQKPLPHFDGLVSVRYCYGRPDKRRCDLGNLEKAVSDKLVDAGIIPDDCLIERILLEWSPDVTGCQIEIEANG